MEHNVKVGDGCTIRYYSDRQAATVVEVRGNRVVVQEDDAKLLNGADSGEDDALKFSPGGFLGHTSGKQRWECTKNPDGTKWEFSLRKSGRWVISGERDTNGATTLNVEGRFHHYDFNF